MNVRRLFVASSITLLSVTVAIPAAAHTPEEWYEEIPHTGLTRELIAHRPLALVAPAVQPLAAVADRGTGRMFVPVWDGTLEFWRPTVEKYFAPEDVSWAMRVIKCESGGDPEAKNPTSSASGLFQHLARYWDKRSADAGWTGHSIWNPEANIAVAAWLHNGGSGASHWVCK